MSELLILIFIYINIKIIIFFISKPYYLKFENIFKFLNYQKKFKMLTSINLYKRTLKFISACQMIPHPSKAHFGGEDSFFISKNNSTIGVADGVGGWADIPGSNAAKYSRDLMKFANENSNLSTSLEILNAAYSKMNKNLIGSTTALVVKINGIFLDILNVGDSGCSLFRNGSSIFQTTDTLHGFNFPYQLGTGSKTLPKDGTFDKIEARPGDILISGSDGLWDNVFLNQIEKEIKISLKTSNSSSYHQFAQSLSKKLALIAHNNGLDRHFISPFSQDAAKAGYRYIGGKLDDITVLTSLIVNDNEI